MATTEELLDREKALEDALASGQSQVRYGEMFVAYRSALEISRLWLMFAVSFAVRHR